MSRDEKLLDDLRRLSESASTLEALLSMDSERIRRLLTLLSDRASIAHLRRLLASVSSIQEASTVPVPTVQTSETQAATPANLESALRQLLSDTERFPTVASIADFCREAFGLRVSHKKKARGRYISTVLSAVKKSPKARYHARNLFAHGQMDEKDERYQLLYKYIRGSLTE